MTDCQWYADQQGAEKRRFKRFGTMAFDALGAVVTRYGRRFLFRPQGCAEAPATTLAPTSIQTDAAYGCCGDAPRNLAALA